MRLPREACKAVLFCPSVHLITILLLIGPAIGRAHASTITANPPNLAFGDVKVGAKSTLPVVLTNTGSSTVSITNGVVQGLGFSVTGVRLPIVLGAGQQYTVNVTFTPPADGSYTGGVSGSNPSGKLVSVSVNGNGTQSGYSVSLSWDPSSSDVVGYNVYRGGQPGGPYAKLNSTLDPLTSYMDDTVLTGTTYYYVTTSVGSNGQESTYSNQTEAQIP